MSDTDAYLTALRMLGRRELSAAQVRQRLARKGFEAEPIEDAIRRLRDGGALDDRRVAEAMARTDATIRRRGRLRVARAIQAAGIDRSTAERALDEVYSAVNEGELLAQALEKRLRGRPGIADAREFARLYRFLSGQGFESDAIRRALKARSIK